MTDPSLRFDFLATLAPSARVEAAGNVLHRVALSLVETGGLKAWQVRGEFQKLALRWARMERGRPAGNGEEAP